MDIGEMLMAALRDQGVELKDQGNDLRVYAAQQAAVLTTLVGQTGFTLAIQAAASSVALRAAQNVVRAADATDQRVIGIIQAVLSIGVRP